MHPIGDQPQGHITPQGRRRDRSRLPVAQARHGVEGMGQHRHAGVVGRHGLGVIGFAVAQADDDALFPQGLDHRSGPLKFGRQRDQGDVGGGPGGGRAPSAGTARRAVKAVDALGEGRQRWGAQMRLGMGAAAGRRQEGALQVGPQQAAASRLVLGPGLAQHRQCLPQGGHGAGHQGGADGLHPIAPEKLEQLLQPGLVGGAEFGEGQPQAAIDLQIDPHRAQPVPAPVIAGGGAAGWQRFDFVYPFVLVEADAPAPLASVALAPVAAGRGLGQAHVAQPAHRRWGRVVPPSCWRVHPKPVALAAAAGAGGWGETPCRRGRCRLRPFAPQCRRRCASAGGGGDGQRFGSAHPAAGRGDPAGAGGGLRGAGAVGPPHPPGDGGLRRGRRRSGPAGDHCRRRRCRPPARHGGGPHPAAGDRCAGAEPGPVRGGFAAFDRADARRHPGRHRGHRQWRQCGPAGGPDLGPGRCRPGPAPGGPPARPA